MRPDEDSVVVADFGQFLAQLGVPLSTLMGFGVTFVEIVGGYS